MFRELLGLFYPRLCVGCDGDLRHGEPFLCTRCLYHLPLTGYHQQSENSLSKQFWGRIPFERAYAYLHFRKEGIAQRLLHELKYKGNKELAVHLGLVYGKQLLELTERPEAVVAVPLHRSKFRKRGYNQSACFASGLAQALGIPDLSNAVGRRTATASQTRKSRFERWINVEETFCVTDAGALSNKHLLVCDDVITTGATIESLVSVLPATCRVSICSIAVPVHS